MRNYRRSNARVKENYADHGQDPMHDEGEQDEGFVIPIFSVEVIGASE